MLIVSVARLAAIAFIVLIIATPFKRSAYKAIRSCAASNTS